MSAERWSQVKQHFLHLADKSPSHRQDYLGLVCADDVPLRVEIEALLKAHDALDETSVDPRSELAPSMDAGQQVGAYTLLERLGRGGAGTVYHAHHPDLGDVALKLLPASNLMDATARTRFEQEAAVLERLRHPALCAVRDVFVTSRFAGIAMARVAGSSLDQRLLDGPMTYAGSLAIIETLLEVLSIAHAAGVVHRDIKPANVMLSDDGCATLIDFGIARLTGVQLTRTGQLIGSPRYMSPEQWRGERVDARSDQFSLGVLWYELLSGKPAFDAVHLGDIAQQVLHAEPAALPALSVDGRHLDRLVPVLHTLLAKQPADRYDDIDALSRTLRDRA